MKDYPYLSEAVSNVLRQKREEVGLSKRRTAELAELERVYLIRLERGEKRPTLNALFYLCDALGLDPEDFIHLVKEEIKRLSWEAVSSPKPPTWQA